jgi:serine/threonine protein kinase
LFGILALLNGFIDRDSLAAAFGVWTTEKNRQLPEILVERGAISPAHQELLLQLAETLLARHGGDPNSSLSTILEHLTDSDRTVIKATVDVSELRESLAVLRASQVLGILDDSTEPATPDSHRGDTGLLSSDDPVDRYRRGKFFRGGGLGQIHLALDREFQRTVALKTIRPEYAQNDSMRERFVLEAEITGNLEHPGVVPAYGLGTSRDGLPYYAMRLVKGRNLRECLDGLHPPAPAGKKCRGVADLRAGGRELRELVRHFVAVCQTLEYAHKRGVIHRDLKPSNLMVGDHGETLVIDWGLAKALGRRLPEDLAPGDSLFVPRTSSGSGEATRGTVGTPGYIPPEQYDEPGDKTTAASDVYALGAILYEVLTGRGPFQELRREVDQIKSATLHGDFPLPRLINPTAPRALEAICLKAMSTKPVQRYSSAAELAEDVKRWQDDEPVSALPETWSNRLGRWERKNRRAVRVGSVALALLAAGATAAALLVTRAWKESEVSRNDAVESLGQVLSLTDRILEKSDQELALFPKSHEFRLSLVQLAEPTLREIGQRSPSDPRAIRSLIRSLLLQGRVHVQLGREAEAKTAIDQAMLLIEPLASSVDVPEVDRGLLADVLLAQAEWFLTEDQPAEARAACSRAHRFLTPPTIDQIVGIPLLRAKCDRIDALARIQAGENATALPLLDRAEAQLEPLLQSAAADAACLRVLQARAELAMMQGDRTRAETDLEHAVELGDSLVGREPGNTEFRLARDLALITRARLAEQDLTPNLDQVLVTRAGTDLNTALADLASMYRRDPDVVEYGRTLIRGFNERTHILLRLRQLDPIQKDLQEQEKIRARFAQPGPDAQSSDRYPGRDRHACDLLETARTHAIKAELAQIQAEPSVAKKQLKAALEAYGKYRVRSPLTNADAEREAQLRKSLELIESAKTPGEPA